MNRIKRHVMQIIVLIIGIILGLAFLSAFASGEGWTDLVDFLLSNLPFSKLYASIAVNLLGNTIGTIGNYSQIINSHVYISVWLDLLKCVVTIILYTALERVGEYILVIRFDFKLNERDKKLIKRSGGILTVKKMINSVFCSVLAAVLSFPTLYLFSNLVLSIPQNVQNIVAIITSSIVIVLAVLACYFLFGDVLKIVLFLFLNTITLNFLIMSINYIFVYTIVFVIHDESAWGKIVNCTAIWIVILIILAGVDFGLSSIIED